MNFFERQHAARNASFRLVFLFTLSIILIVGAIDLIVVAALLAEHAGTGTAIGWAVAATVITLLIIGGGTLSKMMSLRSGGAAVAQSVGATAVDPTTTDPQLRRFVNVVEEMSIASGVPMPRLFVLEREPSINAFAAGYSPADAAITVTGGALEHLNRDELQGVIGHEFSHVLNGDMRLNVRLIGLLSGILLLGLVGLRILAFGPRGGSRGKGGNGAGVILLVGVAMLVLGFIGQFFAGLIQAGVARQREWLADASSVQFTRQTVGLAGALKKIAGLPAGSALHNSHGEKQISHMLFGEGRKRFISWYATHPPLIQRITTLEPDFRADQVEKLQRDWASDPPDGLAEDTRLGLVGGAVPVQARPTVRVDPPAVVARVGTFTPDDLTRGAALSRQIPPNLRQFASQASTAVPLVLALLLDADATVRARQLQAVTARLGQAASAAADELAGQLTALPPLLRLPLVGVCAPSVVARPVEQVRTVIALLDELARTDGVVTIFEYCLTHLVAAYARDALDPTSRSKPGRGSIVAQQEAALTLLAVVAMAGNADTQAAGRAFTAAVSRLMPGQPVPPLDPSRPVSALDGVWDALDALDPRHKQPLIEALVAAVSDDGELAVPEAELLRTACALLHCPLPALLS